MIDKLVVCDKNVLNLSELLASDESTDNENQSFRDSDNEDDFKRKKSKKTKPSFKLDDNEDNEDMSSKKRFVP